MPVQQQQGSRAVLITWLVIFVILFVTTTIMWIYADSLRRKTELSLNDTVRKFDPVISAETMTSSDFTDASAKGDTGQKAFEVVVGQRKELARQIAGDADADKALKTVKDAQTVAETGTGLSNLNGAPLTSIIKSLADRVTELTGEKDALSKQLAASEAKNKTFVDAQEAILKDRDSKITELTAKLDTAVSELKTYEEQASKRFTVVESDTAMKLGQFQVLNKKATDTSVAKTAEVAKLTKTVEELKRKLSAIRPPTTEAIVQSPDGRIIRLPGNDIVYIDLGSGDQVMPGMTFEVYDKNTGIPALGDGLREGDMPKGKASVEVIRPGAGSSEARIIRKTPGESVVEGDFIANLVYDPKTKYNFVVYGDFDLNHDNKASSGEAEVIKRLVNQWGSRTQDAVNVDTDFVVMGKEPVIPEPKADEKDNPQVIKQIEEAQARLDAYNKVRDRAIDLRIPIMNQNRFLYFIGFYNQASR